MKYNMLTVYRLIVHTKKIILRDKKHTNTGGTRTNNTATIGSTLNQLPERVQALLFVLGIVVTLLNLVFLSQLQMPSNNGNQSLGGVLLNVIHGNPSSLRTQQRQENTVKHIKLDELLSNNNNNIDPSITENHNYYHDYDSKPQQQQPQRSSSNTDTPNNNKICADTTTEYDQAQVDRFLHDVRSEMYQDNVDHCIPMQSWQMEYYPTCNVVHELHMSPDVLKFVAKGTTAAVYELLDLDLEKQEERLVLKIPLFHYSDNLYDPDQYEMRRIDAVIQERLTSSPYVGNLHAFCGQSSIVPLATGGSIHDLIVSVRAGGHQLSPKQKLQICIQIAEGLSALHGIDCTDGRQPSFAHNDLDVSQHVFVDGIFQINDFSYGFMLLQHETTHETCKGISHMGHWKYRAPEDFNYHPKDESNEEDDNYDKNNNNNNNDDEYQVGGPYLLEKADVFMMCNEFYMVLTNLWLLEELSRSTGAAAIAKGQRSPIPSEYQNSPHVAIQAIVHVLTTMCWHQHPKDRSTARLIADYLQGEFDKIMEDDVDSDHHHHHHASHNNKDPTNNKNSGRIVRVTLPPLIQASGDYDEKM